MANFIRNTQVKAMTSIWTAKQKARELELRNLQQAFEGNGKPASFEADPSRGDTYTVGALGVMSSYNRIGAVASSANAGVQVQIMRNEWGFKGYNVTDFTGVTLHASPKESWLALPHSAVSARTTASPTGMLTL